MTREERIKARRLLIGPRKMAWVRSSIANATKKYSTKMNTRVVRWVNEVVENPESEASCPNIRSLGPRPPLLIRLFVVNFNSDLDISNFIVI